MKRVRVMAPLAAVLLLGCATTESVNGDSPQASRESAAKTERKREDLERKLDVARARLALARTEEKAYGEDLEARIRHASGEVELARARLARFREADAPNRLATERLELRTARDRAQEAAEELAQIEIMYKDQDLDDLTAEFVVSRGRRAAERAAERIEILEGELRALEERELPQEGERLALELDKAEAGLTKAEREGEIGRQNKAISVKEAENEIARLEDEQAALSEEAQS